MVPHLAHNQHGKFNKIEETQTCTAFSTSCGIWCYLYDAQFRNQFLHGKCTSTSWKHKTLCRPIKEQGEATLKSQISWVYHQWTLFEAFIVICQHVIHQKCLQLWQYFSTSVPWCAYKCTTTLIQLHFCTFKSSL